MSEVISPHFNTSGFATAHVAGKIGIRETGAFGRFGERITNAVAIDAAPGDRTVIVRDIDAEEAALIGAEGEDFVVQECRQALAALGWAQDLVVGNVVCHGLGVWPAIR